MVDRIPFEVEAVKAYLRDMFNEFQGAAAEATFNDSEGLGQALATAAHPAAMVIVFSSGATAFNGIHEALFGESLLPAQPDQKGDAIQ